MLIPKQWAFDTIRKLKKIKINRNNNGQTTTGKRAAKCSSSTLCLLSLLSKNTRQLAPTACFRPEQGVGAGHLRKRSGRRKTWHVAAHSLSGYRGAKYLTFDTNQAGDVARQSKSASDSYPVSGKQMTDVKKSMVLIEQRPSCPDIYPWYLLWRIDSRKTGITSVKVCKKNSTN